MIGYCKYLKYTIISEADCYYCIRKKFYFSFSEADNEGIIYVLKNCIYWTTKTVIRYRCNICGRDKFQRPNTRHWCKGNYRKSKYEGFEKIVKYEGEK